VLHLWRVEQDCKRRLNRRGPVTQVDVDDCVILTVKPRSSPDPEIFPARTPVADCSSCGSEQRARGGAVR
jgi:hypothetical protein